MESGREGDPYSVIVDNLSEKIKSLRSAIELTHQTIARDRDGILKFEKEKRR